MEEFHEEQFDDELFDKDGDSLDYEATLEDDELDDGLSPEEDAFMQGYNKA